MSPDEDDERLARDLQMALDLQDQEERNQKRRSKRHDAKHHANQQEAGLATRSALSKPGHMLFVLCKINGATTSASSSFAIGTSSLGQRAVAA
jgi:hypothetical protein